MRSREQEYCGNKAARRARSRGVRIVAIFCLMMLAAAAAPASRGQRAEKCNESTVRKKSLVPVTQVAADDIYANTMNSKGPLEGKAKVEELRKANLAERKNSKPTVFSPNKIVTSKAGDMAYDYGKAHVEYDLASTGQHIAYDVEYLRVWKVNGGVCQVEGIFSRADKLSEINK
jgi:ketosteroid isomerase-like protein